MTSPPPGGARTVRPTSCSWTTTRTPATTRSLRPTPSAASPTRVSAPVRWEEINSFEPDDFTIFTMPARFAEIGDLHGGIDNEVFDIAPLPEWADRDEAAGAEPPADPED
ncbi:hypothetical protein LP418_23560 [Nocardioides sp. B-3]|nr:hypothetical protein [Nocardioides sp. B-3]UUZ58970.1 hypothetical protein LP418_23560 [Nocardioides sp. B-3]